MTLAVGSKGSRGWRSLGNPCVCRKRRGEEHVDIVLITELIVKMISHELTWEQDEEALSVL